MKTEVYSWRLSAAKKADLENEARREGTSLSALLDRVTAGWRNGDSDDEEQVTLRKRVMATVGTIHGDAPPLAERARELVRETIYKKHLKESNALARCFDRRTD